MRDIVVVLGMHRSGTSVCAHALQILGVDMATEEGPGPGNKGGHWERFSLAGLNDRVLALYGIGPGYSAGMAHHYKALPPAWWAAPEVRLIRDQLIAEVQGFAGLPRPGFKDPRVAILMPLWREVLDALGLRPRFVLCLRNPAQVARSLAARDGLEWEVGEYQWLLYNTQALVWTTGEEICFLDYDAWFPDPLPNARRLSGFLGLPSRRVDDVAAGLRGVVRPEERHGSSSDSARLGAVAMLWGLLTEAVGQGAMTPPLGQAASWTALALSAAIATHDVLQGRK